MNNLICVFFGHKRDVESKLFKKFNPKTDDFSLAITSNGVPIADFFMCKRCSQIFIKTRQHGEI